MNQEEVFIQYIDEVYAAQGLAPEHLAVNTEDYVVTYELTINFPRKKLSILEHIECYKSIWAHLKKIYNTEDALYFIEYCKSGDAHLHGYLRIKYPINAYSISDEHFLKDVAKQIYLMLPKVYWKQYTKNLVFNEYYRRVKAPAVCINMKNYLSTNWVNYIKKNAQEIT